MYTQYKREDLENLIMGEHELYNAYSLVADKLRVIYTALGWTHMTAEFFKADEVVEEVTQRVLESLLSDRDEITIGSGGLNLRGYWDDDNLVLEYNFHIA